ncbi:hypothetical protein CLAFUW4_14679 [Fulvia fulva]|nr:hypothetical protein CLAFUW4_14679 [Fulvia fulva]
MLKEGVNHHTATVSAGPSSADDYNIINELLEAVERNPNSGEARCVLAEQYDAWGWKDAAGDFMEEILGLQPEDSTAREWLAANGRLQECASTASTASTAVQATESNDDIARKFLSPGGLRELGNGYKLLLSDAQGLLSELQAFQDMCGPETDIAGQIADVRAIAEGRLTSAVKARAPPAVRTVAQGIKQSPAPQRVDNVCNDLEANVRWIRNQASGKQSDQIRETVRKRAEAIKAALAPELHHFVDDAWMHVEHEILGRKYQNGGQTMLGDLVIAIPRTDFYCSGDGYAWDMAELASAIKANGGVMRNPLSKQLFSADDVRSIIRHPLGKGLAALQLKQKELTSGVRKSTISKLNEMAAVLLGDQTLDAAASREAVEGFLTYTATLPQAEQNALKDLRVPAKDSHTEQPFDVTIGDAVEDAKANRQCFHKTGDLLSQAARFLASQKMGTQMPGAWS